MTSAPRALQSADGGPLDLAAVEGALSADFTVVTGPARAVRQARLDTFDRRLDEAGLTLEHRSSASGEELVLVRPDSAPPLLSPATDLRSPAFAHDLPDGALRAVVSPVIGIRALMAVTDEKRRVRRVEVHDQDGKTVARLDLDEPVAATSTQPAEVRVLSLRGYDDAARRTTRLLSGIGLRPPEAEDRGPADVPSPEDMAPAAAATVLLAGALNGYLGAMRENLPGLLDDVDTEFLHDFRVAVRRTRSTLKLGRPALPEVMRSRWEPAFKWLGDLTTPMRDLDVYQLDLPTMSGWLVAAAPGDLEPFVAHLQRRRSAERRTLVRGLRSARYAALVADWERALTDLADTSSDQTPDQSSEVLTAGALAGTSISRAFRRVARDGGAVTADSPSEDLHSLRKRCKELRYALEVFTPVIDKPARKSAVGDLKALQDVLGRFQDSEVQGAALREFAEEMVSDGTSAGAVLAMGELVGRLDAEQDRARQDFESAFARFVGPATRVRMQRLGGAG